jgi:hypothetical protein
MSSTDSESVLQITLMVIIPLANTYWYKQKHDLHAGGSRSCGTEVGALGIAVTRERDPPDRKVLVLGIRRSVLLMDCMSAIEIMVLIFPVPIC